MADTQCFVLLNIAHRRRAPRRAEGAAIRILGLFPSGDALRAQAPAYSQRRVHRLHKLGARRAERQRQLGNAGGRR